MTTWLCVFLTALGVHWVWTHRPSKGPFMRANRMTFRMDTHVIRPQEPAVDGRPARTDRWHL